jgi:hypothetical protein
VIRGQTSECAAVERQMEDEPLEPNTICLKWRLNDILGHHLLNKVRRAAASRSNKDERDELQVGL